MNDRETYTIRKEKRVMSKNQIVFIMTDTTRAEMLD